MPLKKVCSLGAFRDNLAAEIAAGRDSQQAARIAHETLRDSCKAEGKSVPRTDSIEDEHGLRVDRFDYQTLGKAKRTPQGFMKFDANLTRTGVLTYKKPDGSDQRELRHPDEIFKADSLETLSGAPVTDLHSQMVSPANVRQLAVGIVGEQIKHDEKFVQGHVTIQDQTTIEKVAAGDRKEISSGYRCHLDFSPGVYNGEHYDAIQRSIVYNHVGIGPEGWGRAGSEVALRTDGNQDFTPPPGGSDKPKENGMKRVIKIDGIPYELDTDTGQQAIQQVLEKRDSEILLAQEKAQGLQEKLDASEKKAKDLQKKLDEATDPARIETLVNERADLIAKARTVLGAEEKLDGLSPQDIRVKVLTKLDETFKADGLDEAYVKGQFDHAIKNFQAEQKTDGLSSLRGAIPTIQPQVKDDKKDLDKYDSAAAEERMRERSRDAWQPKENSAS